MALIMAPSIAGEAGGLNYGRTVLWQRDLEILADEITSTIQALQFHWQMWVCNRNRRGWEKFWTQPCYRNEYGAN